MTRCRILLIIQHVWRRRNSDIRYSALDKELAPTVTYHSLNDMEDRQTEWLSSYGRSYLPQMLFKYDCASDMSLFKLFVIHLNDLTPPG